MDNRQVYVPFLNPRFLGRAYSPDTYQYHMLAIALDAEDPQERVHGQITTLKSALMHPILQRLPVDLATAVAIGRACHGALGVVNVNFRDTRRTDNVIELTDQEGSNEPVVTFRYSPETDEPDRVKQAVGRIRKALRKLGCFALPGMTETRPLGSSVHYAGTLPMSCEAKPLTTTEFCQSREFDNLFVVDGSTFPFLPAKNSTFTLMANAVRVAESAF